MKRNIFKALAALTALVFASCTMGNTIEKQNDNTDGKTAYITIGLNEIARTALPGVENEDDFDKFNVNRYHITHNKKGFIYGRFKIN